MQDAITRYFKNDYLSVSRSIIDHLVYGLKSDHCCSFIGPHVPYGGLHMSYLK